MKLETNQVLFIFHGDKPYALDIFSLLDGGVPVDEDGIEAQFIGTLHLESRQFIEVEAVFDDDGSEKTVSIWSILEGGTPIYDGGEPLEFLWLQVEPAS